ncbi:MAG: succinate--CoA ligase subunit beta [Chloroflexi bacterium]|nr:succinate--CoA ligase subunit beta [Chloroflexota bacterium]
MKLYEFEGSELYRQEGIPVPNYALASSPEEAREKAKEIGLPVVIKAQVLIGGRGLAGGIKTAKNLDEVEAVAQRILNSQIRGYPVHKVMITQWVEKKREYYLGITVDGYRGTPVVSLSTAGGVSIEGVARSHPELVTSRHVPAIEGLLPDAQQMAKEAGLRGEEMVRISSILRTLYSVFCKYDALVAEINPLVRTKDGMFVALDSKVEIDDSSLYRHPELKKHLEERIFNPLERKGREIGVTYVELEGDIAIIASGAGLGMASMDIISQKMHPANFLETGGGITADLLYKVMDLVLQKKGIRGIFINVYGGINPIHEGARGIGRYIEEHKVKIPIVAKALGNHQEETWEILRQHGVHVVTDPSTEKGVDLLARLMEEGR